MTFHPRRWGSASRVGGEGCVGWGRTAGLRRLGAKGASVGAYPPVDGVAPLKECVSPV